MLAMHLIHSSGGTSAVVKGDESKPVPDEDLLDSAIFLKVSLQLVFLDSVGDISNKYSIPLRHFLHMC